MKRLIAIFSVAVFLTLSLSGQDKATDKTKEEKKVVASTNVYNDGKFDYVSFDTKFTLEVSEDGVGVKTIYYSVDGNSNAKEYKEPISVKGEGKHQIFYWVLNNLGETSKILVYEFFIDSTAPKAKIKASKNESKLLDGLLYVATSEEFVIQAIDNLSGLKSIEYSLDDGEFKEYSAPIVADFSYGKHKLSYRASDNVGNISELKELSIFVDNKAPMVDIKIKPEAFVKDDKKYVNEKTLFSVKADDYDIGVETISYSINDETPVTYVMPFNLAKYDEGEYTITVKAIDFAGNEITETLQVILDKSISNVTITPVLLQ